MRLIHFTPNTKTVELSGSTGPVFLLRLAPVVRSGGRVEQRLSACFILCSSQPCGTSHNVTLKYNKYVRKGCLLKQEYYYITIKQLLFCTKIHFEKKCKKSCKCMPNSKLLISQLHKYILDERCSSFFLIFFKMGKSLLKLTPLTK